MTLYTLGTGAAVSDPFRSTTMLAVEAAQGVILIDCGGDVGQRAMAAGIPLDWIEALILTHEHPDHVAGFPLLMEKLWLSGRNKSLPVYGIGAALEQVFVLATGEASLSEREIMPKEVGLFKIRHPHVTV